MNVDAPDNMDLSVAIYNSVRDPGNPTTAKPFGIVGGTARIIGCCNALNIGAVHFRGVFNLLSIRMFVVICVLVCIAKPYEETHRYKKNAINKSVRLRKSGKNRKQYLGPIMLSNVGFLRVDVTSPDLT